MRRVVAHGLPWREPLDAAAPFAGEPWTLLLLSDGTRGRWSYLLRAPAETLTLRADDRREAFGLLRELGCPSAGLERLAEPPFQGGVAGLAGYGFGARCEAGADGGDPAWPQLSCGRYPALLAFDHHDRRVLAIGRGDTVEAAAATAAHAAAWLDVRQAPAPISGPLGVGEPVASVGDTYEAAVAEVVARIAAGEIFQANIARRWTGRLAAGAAPFDLMRRLAGASPAPFAAYLRLPGAAVVSNSPERFLSLDPGGMASSKPIKGTRPRGATETADAALAAELLASAKDRAENLMIVDLMRNDLARVCAPGSIEVPALCVLESYANVHHLVSTVRGRLGAGRDWVDLLAACFPPGSVTGAPKVQALRVIAALEPPRGPYCGSLFWVGADGAMDASVLIRTVELLLGEGGWRWEARAGAGIVADSNPAAERAETEAKISAILAALA